MGSSFLHLKYNRQKNLAYAVGITHYLIKKMFLVSDYAVSFLSQMSSPVEDTHCTHKRAEVTSNTVEGEGICLKI